MENARTTIWVMSAVLAFVVTSVLAAPSEDNFTIQLNASNECGWGGGSGFNDGNGELGTPWYYYPNTDWNNQWFYDGLPDPDRWKEITYNINIETSAAQASVVTIALNWSTLAYPESGGDLPPLPTLIPTLEQENAWIVREVIFNDTVVGPVNFEGTFIIPDYNPEWVSIDIRAYGAFVTTISGTITHECIPAPGAVLLGSIGVGLVGWLRRRRAL